MNYVEPIRDSDKIRELANYLRNYSERNYIMFLIGVNSGLRISDILRLRVRAYEILRKAGEVLGLYNLGTHTLRKTFGYQFYIQYKDVVTLQKIFNHSSPAITLRYIGVEQNHINNMIKGFKIF